MVRLLLSIVSLIFAVLAASCGKNQGKMADRKDMAYILDSVSRAAQPEEMFYLNSRRVELFRKKLNNPSSDKTSAGKSLIQELLYSGKNEEAIHTADSLLGALFPSREVTLNNKPFHDLLALAWLRKGEAENCILNHSTESCIIPIRGGGIHQQKEGSLAAIEIYKRILKAFPEDLQSRWLVNIAYMTTGDYPHNVPPDLYINVNHDDPVKDLPVFADIAPLTGLDVNEQSGGCVMEDFNNDGYLDVMASSFGLTDPIRVFFNNGQGGFEDKTATCGLDGIGSGLNLISGDYNNDGFTDVFVLRNGWLGKAGKIPNSLLRNNGDGTFTDVTIEAGLLSFYATQTAAFADYNNDGWLDLFIGNEFGGDHPYPCEFFVNNGDGSFSNRARDYGLEVNAFVKGVIWGDINNDGWQDLYVSVLGGTNKLFLNKQGKGFEDIAARANVTAPFFSFATWFFDYDNDGWLDLWACGYNTRRYGNIAYDAAAEYLGKQHYGELPKLYRNKGDNTFEDVTEKVHLNKLAYGMGSNFGDLDNDGYPDLYIGTGAPEFGSVVPNRVFKNIEGQRFAEITTQGKFGQIQKGHAVSFGDIDNDGDQDIYAVIGGFYEGDIYQNMLLQNQGNQSNWTVLQLHGKNSNRSAIGARIRITGKDATGNTRTIHTVVNSGGSFGASSLQQETGLGTMEIITELEVRWPDKNRTVSVYKNVPAKKKISITEGEPSFSITPYQPFSPSKAGGPAMHHHH